MIRLLDQKTIDKIAAGEVIERPASIVKELVENSIDAGATRISVEIRDGGTTFIRVTDNGCGISKEEIRTAYLRHATSKLETVEDLIGVDTLGFRGEALSTIAAVTETEMITKTKDSVSAARYVIHGGNEIEFSETGAPDGTTIIARNIFFNTPVRLKFLKSNMTEGSYINDLVSQIALSHPEIAFNLVSNGRTIVDTGGNGNIKETIYQLFGKEITKNLLPCDYTEDSIHITGFVGKPFLSRGNRSFEYYYINHRYIKNNIINRALEEAYKTYVMQHRFPFVVLYIELNQEECDVNVHPTKREFKFNNEKLLFSAVFHAVQDALAGRSMIPTADVDYGQKDPGYLGSKDRVDEYGRQPKVEEKTFLRPVTTMEKPLEQPTKRKVESRAESKPQPVKGTSSSFSILDKLLPESYRKQLAEQVEQHAEQHVVQQGKEAAYEIDSYKEKEPAVVKEPVVVMQPQKVEEPVKAEEPEKVEEAAYYSFSGMKFTQTSLEDDNYLSAEAKPHHEIVGQIFGTYWISTYKGAMYLMDQHAAHEKVNYERFLKEFKERHIESQRIFPPMIISLSAQEKAAVMENIERFEETGFDLSDFGGNDVKLGALPVNLVGLKGEDVFLEFASYLADGISGVTEDIFVHKIASMGCKAAIKGGANWQISRQEAEHLIDELMSLDNPYTCPHGRPTIVKMTKEEIDKKFKRIVE